MNKGKKGKKAFLHVNVGYRPPANSLKNLQTSDVNQGTLKLSSSSSSGKSYSSSSSGSEHDKNCNYFTYYFTAMLTNAGLVSIYSVETFSLSPQCSLPSSTIDMTKWFDIAFTGGWILHCISFFFSAFVDPVCIKRSHHDSSRRTSGRPTAPYQLML